MPALTREVVSGVVHVTARLHDESAVEPGALVASIKAWGRLVNASGFATGRVARIEAEAAGRTVRARLDCESIPLVALSVLQRMVERLRGSGALAETVMLRREEAGLSISAPQALRLPDAFPFELEQPVDLRRLVRIEIEFRSPLAEPDRAAVSGLLSSWDVLAEALGEPQGPGAAFEGHTRMLGPSMVEHEIIEYTPSFESLDYVVFLMLRLHERLPITRLTIE